MSGCRCTNTATCTRCEMAISAIEWADVSGPDPYDVDAAYGRELDRIYGTGP